PLYPVGGRTLLNYGYPEPAPGVLVSTSALTQTVDYPARDMTITVEAGIRMNQLSEALKTEQQQLPIDVPQANRATLGGIVATNVSGPRRYGYGTLRDYVIGVSAVDAQGRLFKTGGRVVKNVAGYDLCKLLIGSMGTLAIMTQVTLKLRPLSETISFLWASFRSFAEIDDVLQRLISSQTRPVALEVLNSEAVKQIAAESRQQIPTTSPILAIGIEGTRRDVNWQIETLKQELAPFKPNEVEVLDDENAIKFRTSLTEFQCVSDDPLTFRANVLPSDTMKFAERATQLGVAVQAHAGNGIVIGTLPDQAVTVEKAAEIVDPLRAFARKNRGNLVVLYCENEWKRHIRVFGEPEPSHLLMLRLKDAFDPHHLLNPGRFLENETHE
ncbi:MAG: FAD-binding oxidoreductase, partial [Planctomycetes bacterium]|nr:FAD-binding oxidoreductase [Planctomycetota bacterium]